MHHRTIMAMAVFASVSITLAETHEIELYSTSFVPSAVDALPGDTIRWTFVTGYPHTVDSGTGCVPDGLFSASLSSPDQVFEWTVPEDAPTQIPFFCDPHCGNGMSGVINVLPSTEPGRLLFGIIDVSSGNIQMEIDEELGQGFLLVDALDGSFAFGFEVENGDVDVNFSARILHLEPNGRRTHRQGHVDFLLLAERRRPLEPSEYGIRIVRERPHPLVGDSELVVGPPNQRRVVLDRQYELALTTARTVEIYRG